MEALHDWSPEEIESIVDSIAASTTSEDLHGRLAQFLLNLRCPPLFVHFQSRMKELRDKPASFAHIRQEVLQVFAVHIQPFVKDIAWTRAKDDMCK